MDIGIINTILELSFIPAVLLGSFYVGTTLGGIERQKIILNKLSPYNDKIIADKNFVFEKTSFLKKEMIDFRKKQVLKPYVLELCHHVSADDLKIIANNIKTVKIERDPLILFRGNSGSYFPEKNYILYALKSALGHEFLHFASTIFDEETGITLVGFLQNKGDDSIGWGVNEGYTELLASRWYNKNQKVTACRSLVKFAQLIEFFFDKPSDMSHLYFNCNLPGLIEHLEQYASKEEVMKLIFEMDTQFHFYKLACTSPIRFIQSVQIQLKLYNWFKSKCKDPKKLREFEQLACQNKVVSLLIKMKKMKLYRIPPFKAKNLVTIQLEKSSNHKKVKFDDQAQQVVIRPFSKIESTEFNASASQKIELEKAKAILIDDSQQLEQSGKNL